MPLVPAAPQSSKLAISVCVVSGAEAHRISTCLASVADWVSEIVVVLDDRARDGTEAVVERFGGRVFREPWKGFVGQKNSAAAKCSQPWLLNLDADEAVSPDLRAEIVTLFEDQSRLEAHAAFESPRCTFFGGRWIRHGDWYPDRVCRLWRRGAAEWVGDEPHAFLRVHGRTGRLHSDLHHSPAETLDCQLEKIRAYSTSFVAESLARGRCARWVDLGVRPWWRFFRAYVLRLGMLDGWPGYYIAWNTAFYTVHRYAKIREARRRLVPPDHP